MEKSIKNNSQAKKFKKHQQDLLVAWSNEFVTRLNTRLADYNIKGLHAQVEAESHGEKIDIHFPRTIKGENDYQLDHILLEFDGRNRGKPTDAIDIDCYMSSIEGFHEFNLPKATVKAYQKDFILWEKLTPLHQLATQEREPNPNRLARHWYDVDCLLQMRFEDPYKMTEARYRNEKVSLARKGR